MIMNRKTKTYLISGLFLTYFGLKDNFLIFYNGIALLLGLTALYMAYREYKNEKKD